MMKRIDDHPQIPYRYCNICKRTYAVTEKGKVLIIPENFLVRDGNDTRKVRPRAPHINMVCDCGTKVHIRAHHQVVPCIGDIVRVPLDPKQPRGITHKGKVTNILYYENNMPSLKVAIEVYIRIDSILASHQTVPRIGDVVRFLVGTEQSGDMTPPVKVLNILSDNETGFLHGFMVEWEDDVDLMGVRLEHCPKWDEADDGTTKIE